MNLFILGAGEVGGSIASFLNDDPSIDVTVIDIDPEAIDRLKRRGLDLKAMVGNTTHPDVLQDAGIEDAEVLLAVTGSDEVNLVACQLCYALFSTPKRIARVRASNYDTYRVFDSDPPIFAVDEIINPEAAVTDRFLQLIKNLGASEVLRFGQGTIEVVTLKTLKGSVLAGRDTAWVQERIRDLPAEVIAVQKVSQRLPVFVDQLPPTTGLEPDDQLTIVSDIRLSRQVFQALKYSSKTSAKVAIAGGGHVGERLADELILDNPHNQVQLIELDSERAQNLESKLKDCIVLQGDVTDKNLLESNNIHKADIFCAITNEDEINFLSSLLAKQLGIPRVLALIKNPDYMEIVAHAGIDTVISPEQSTAAAIFKHVREVTPDVIQGLNDNRSQIVGVTVKPGLRKQIIGSSFSTLNLPESARLIAVRRRDDILLGDDIKNLVFEAYDHLVIFIADEQHLGKVESLFRLQPIF